MQIKQGKGSEGGKKKNKKQNTHVLCSSRPASLLVQCLFSFLFFFLYSRRAAASWKTRRKYARTSVGDVSFSSKIKLTAQIARGQRPSPKCPADRPKKRSNPSAFPSARLTPRRRRRKKYVLQIIRGDYQSQRCQCSR